MSILNGISELRQLDVPAVGDLKQVAQLHTTSLPGSQVSQLGEDFAVSFYRYICRSPHEIIVVYSRDEEIVGGAVVSFEIKSLKQRLLWHTRLLYAVLLALIVKSPFRKSVLSRFRKSGLAHETGDDDLPPVWNASPELVLLFVESSLRGKGVGSELVAACEKVCVQRGCKSLRVKTLLEEDNLALKFYDARDYRRVGLEKESGKSYVAFVKSLDVDGRAPS